MNQTPLDVTARCVRPAGKHEPQTLLGAEIPLAFLKRHLLDRTTPNSRLLPNKQTVMLYGRRGCGKNTLIHATDPSGKRLFLDSPAFGEIHDWKMRPWNGAEFAEWAKQHAQSKFFFGKIFLLRFLSFFSDSGACSCGKAFAAGIGALLDSGHSPFQLHSRRGPRHGFGAAADCRAPVPLSR
jgi:hypothetical protein